MTLKHKRKEKYKTNYELIQPLPQKSEINWSLGRGKGLSTQANNFCALCGNIMNVLFDNLIICAPKPSMS